MMSQQDVMANRLRGSYERLTIAEWQLIAVAQEMRQLLAEADPADEDRVWGLRAEVATVDGLLRRTRRARGHVGQALRRMGAATLYSEAARLLCESPTEDHVAWSNQTGRHRAAAHRSTISRRRLAAAKVLQAAILEDGDQPVRLVPGR